MDKGMVRQALSLERRDLDLAPPAERWRWLSRVKLLMPLSPNSFTDRMD